MKTSANNNYGVYKNKNVSLYTIENEKGTRISVADFAGIWQEYSVLDSENNRHNLLLQPKTFDNFTDNGYFINRVIGRTSGRIGDSILYANNTEYQLDSNNGSANLHGGANGFHEQFFDVLMHENSITLSRTQLKSEDNFPGDLDIAITYTLFEDNTVTVTFQGTQLNEDGVFNPTHHAYWNLSDDQNTILNHELKLASTQHLQLGEGGVPDGRIVNNANTGYDFSEFTKIENNINELTQAGITGIDDVYVINNNQEPVAILRDPNTNRQLEISSTRNGLVVFTTAPFDDSMTFTSGKGHSYIAIALEPHTLPNPDKFPDFGTDIIKKDETQEFTLTYKIKD
jgi:aldose 1-epimerase